MLLFMYQVPKYWIFGINYVREKLFRKKMLEKAGSKKIDPIPGPHCTTDRIGIVGAGWGGVDMAFQLKRQGFQNVKIMEKDFR